VTIETKTDQKPAAQGQKTEDKVVPLAALEALRRELKDAKNQIEQLRQSVPADTGKAKPNEKREYTRAELTALVRNGQLTEAAANQLWDEQQAAKVKNETLAAVQQTLQADKAQTAILAEIEAYKANVPGVMEEGSPARDKVFRKFQYLVHKLGMPENSYATQLAALHAAFGDLSELPGEREEDPEPSRETGGSRRGGAADDDDKDDEDSKILKKLSAREKEFYRARVGKGKPYPSWKAVAEEIKFANPELRKRYSGARG